MMMIDKLTRDAAAGRGSIPASPVEESVVQASSIAVLPPIRGLSGNLFEGWVQPTDSPENLVDCTHPTIVKQAFPESLFTDRSSPQHKRSDGRSKDGRALTSDRKRREAMHEDKHLLGR